ncbi:putative FAD dependent oxidoreductase-like protein [Botryosphaeria dothidea]|uniref:FAD dependent oxidoreductase-like protein n=1 Tax=Botryosphaeria dothidea TaxID=55169 RepID=A0A8H4ND32_9PEZI|nr:putative FAD dependent oxidoreductase-like protein [Botryosphaeria dothidea]
MRRCVGVDQSWVLTPTVFLPWLRGQLEAAGVAFKRVEVRSLEDLKGMGHDVLINATGWGARYLGDVADRDVEQIFRRVHDGLPYVFPERPSDFKVVRDIVGIRPQRKTGARVERDDVHGQKVVHAYGAPGGGYVYSFGMAREVARLVDEIEQEIPKAKL